MKTPPRPVIGGAKYRLIEDRLGKSPIKIIDAMRKKMVRRGDGSMGPASFNTIAAHLSEQSGESVTYESVRRWFEQAHPELTGAESESEPEPTGKGPDGVPPAVFSGGE